MKYILALAATAVGLVAAQDFTGQPECAVNCLREFIPQIGCALDDTGCQCNSDNQARLRPLITPCFLSNCNATELSQALNAASTACAAFLATASGDVPVSGTPTGGSSSSAAASSGSASGTGGAALSSLISSITNAASSALESATATGSESSSETASGEGESSESESRSVVVTTFTSDGSTIVQTTTPTESAEEGGASSTTGGNGAAATAAPLAGMAIAALFAAAL